MAEEFDTSWFDLKNYEAFKTMSLVEWIKRLSDRHLYYGIFGSYQNGYIRDDVEEEEVRLFLSRAADCLKKGDSTILVSDVPKSSRSSVNDLTMFEVWIMAQDDRLIHIQPDRCEDAFNEEIVFQPYGIDEDHQAIVNINLFATDEQIKQDFTDWLENSRRMTDIKPQKKLFSQVDFDYWIEYGVIQYLDLVLIAKIEGKKITQNQLARLIFPNEYNIDIVERLRKVTKPTAESLMKNKTYKSLSVQLAKK